MKPAEQRRMKEVIRLLRLAYPEAECSLSHRNSFELLIATILSAQCTDERVNKVTPALFKRFESAKEMAAGDLKEIEDLIKTTGFYKNKAISLKECSRQIMEEHGGKVPRTLDELIALRGVGRKTANVVLGNAFGTPGLVVDTHVKRLTYRLGFTKSTNPEKIEQEMMKIVSQEDWTDFAHLLISHGRAICTARRAYCEECPIARLCPKIGV